MERTTFDAVSSVAFLWRMLDLPQEALDSLDLPSDRECLPSSFRVDVLAQSTVAASALVAALFWSHRNGCSMPRVTVPAEHACVEFKSERLYTLNGKAASPPWGAIGGFYQAVDGYVRIHDSFPNHREIALRILGLPQDASKEVVAQEVSRWKAVELEAEGFRSGAVIAALRSLDQWDALPQAKAIADHPVLLTRLATSELRKPLARTPKVMGKCLEGIRVVEMSRGTWLYRKRVRHTLTSFPGSIVIAAPVAGKTLAAHGADVIWITSPHLSVVSMYELKLEGRCTNHRYVHLDLIFPISI